MPSYTEQLALKGLLPELPHHVRDGIQYEIVMGSIAYGVSNDNSDMDVYGFSIPPKEVIFPSLRSATANRYLALIRSVLRASRDDWNG